MTKPTPRAGFSIATILPYEESFTYHNAGAVSLFVRDTTLNSAYQNNITVFGHQITKQRLFSNIHYQGNRPFMPLLLGKNNGYAQTLVKNLRKLRPKLIEVHNDITLFNILAQNFANTPISIYFHDDPANMNGARTPAQRWKILSRADAIYCCSHYIRRRFLTGLEAGRTDHVHVVYQGIDNTPKPKRENVLLYVGHLTQRKGPLELAHAARMILPHHPDWRIVFAGESRPNKNSDKYRRDIQAALAPLKKQAVFMGHLPHEKILELFSHAPIAVVPSIQPEPIGRTAIEAMSGGCALVTSGHGGLTELAGDVGVIVSPVTAQGLALALQGLIEDQASREQVQQRCAQRGAWFALAGMQRYFDDLRRDLLTKAYGK